MLVNIIPILTVALLSLGLLGLLRSSKAHMDKEVHGEGSHKALWTHIFMLEVLLLSYVGINLVVGTLSGLVSW